MSQYAQSSPAKARCYHEYKCEYQYFKINIGDLEGKTTLTGIDPGIIYRVSMNPQIDYYSENNQYHLINKISSTSATCSKNGKTMYETICSGKRKGSCTSRQTWTSNGCQSTSYTAGGTAVNVEGAEFGTCTCNTGYFNTQNECNTALSNYNCPDDKTCSCENSAGCYSIVEKPRYFKFKVKNQYCSPNVSGNCDNTNQAYMLAVIQKFESTDTNTPSGTSTIIYYGANDNLNHEPGKYRIYVTAYHPSNIGGSQYSTFDSFSFMGRTFNTSSNGSLWTPAVGGSGIYIDYDMVAGNTYSVDYLNGFKCRCSTDKPWGGTVHNN